MYVTVYRLCVVLLVKDGSGYNDTITRLFRQLTVLSSSNDWLSFVYLDESKQGEFVKALGELPKDLRSCEDSGEARPVSYMK